MTEGAPRNPDGHVAQDISEDIATGVGGAAETSEIVQSVFGHALPRSRPRISGEEIVAPPVDIFAYGRAPDGAQDRTLPGDDSGFEDRRARALDPNGPAPYSPRPLDLTSPAARRELPPLPNRFLGVSPWDAAWFAASFIAPVLIASIYYLFIASSQYVVDVHYTVRTPDTAATASGSSAQELSLLTGSGQTGTVDQDNAFVLDDYTKSAQAARDLNARLDLRKMYTRKGVDFLSRLKSNSSEEDLAAYWKKMSYSLTDPATGLSILKVRAFTPQDAYMIANTMLDLYGGTVNNLGRLSRGDSLRYAEVDVERQRKMLADLTSQMTALRNSNNVVDPMTNTVASNIAIEATLRSNAAQIQSQMTALAQQVHNPNAPQLSPMRAQLAATQQQLHDVEGQIARAEGSDPGISKVVGEFEKLTALRAAVETALATAVTNLQSAQTNVDSQRIYVDPYVRPILPRASTYPNRIQSIAVAALIFALIWVVGLLVGHSLVDHT